MASNSNFNPEDFGANDWLVDEMYEKFKNDPNSVDENWKEIFKNYNPDASAETVSTPATQTAASTAQANPATGSQATQNNTPAQTATATTQTQVAPTPEVTKTQVTTAATPAQTAANSTAAATPQAKATTQSATPSTTPKKKASATLPEESKTEALKGISKAIALNMDESLTVPTATSVRAVPAKLLIDNRIVINNHLKRTRGGKISFTHLIGFAVIKALKAFPSMNISYDVIDGKPSQIVHDHVNFGLAIDLPKPDGSRALVVPNIKAAEEMDFKEFWQAYDELVKKTRANKLTPADYAGTTVSLTNPGGIGTVHSVPRLSKGQAAIIGVGALEYPAEFQGASEDTLAKQGISKVITLTSTYDHRVIQGAASGEFLKIVHGYLLGEEDFYNEIFRSLEIPYAAIPWNQDHQVNPSDEVGKTGRIQEMIQAYRTRGHLMADINPLDYKQRSHPDLDIGTYGLTLWDLDREWPVDGLSGKNTMKLRDILGLLRDSYCRTVGVEYMHISDPEQRQWFQEKLENPYEKPSPAKQLRILSKLNEAEAFETFLQTKFVGQKRFSLEGGESLIPMLDEILHRAAKDGLNEVAIGMPHRGRLNVLTNIAGKSYSQVFGEFEGNISPGNPEGSGDVKYHLGTEGVYVGDDGQQTNVYLAANPSHLEAVNTVLEGIARAKQDKLRAEDEEPYSVLPILIHGDSAMAGQGIVQETLQLSQLEGYGTGGTIHIVVNNQVGFTTRPSDSRSSRYCTDVVKMIEAPIFHVNGDDPEAVVHVAELAFEYRERFNRDIAIDMVCYRRRGHNEGDDPSMTQPLMYNEINELDNVRNLYIRDLIGRKDITEAEAQSVINDFQAKLNTAFEQTKAAQNSTESQASSDTIVSGFEKPSSHSTAANIEENTAVSPQVIETVGNAYVNIPEGFTIHPKLKRLLETRAKMSQSGGIDWGFGEILALGSLLLEGKNIRFGGEDARRGTFVQRHATFHDRDTDDMWIPLNEMSENQGKLAIYDSLLSEFGALGFEYGYSIETPEGLTFWEAQFGDFANGAQTITDEFISSAEQKWGQNSNLVMLLPHGYEGQGPDHSSARIERFLQMSAEKNMTVVFPSTPASYFHALRRQAYSTPNKPLIVFTPKSMLRLKAAASNVQEFTEMNFMPVFPETARLENVNRVLLCAGKVYYDLVAAREKANDTSTAILRLEQLYPTPVQEVQAELAKYPNASLHWVQDEPKNQGAWPHMSLNLAPELDRELSVYSRPASASTAAGTGKKHAAEQQTLLQEVFGE
ncbi:MAG: multifunctional oxoglutarate decarboxylase/oxoglutarate dehydrogenase thiamine pyrophosphate-binding subunit/dihydrolipoyllysine-residue succinyltransferase subunit [Micrococcaceae bacterium]